VRILRVLDEVAARVDYNIVTVRVIT